MLVRVSPPRGIRRRGRPGIAGSCRGPGSWSPGPGLRSRPPRLRGCAVAAPSPRRPVLQMIPEADEPLVPAQDAAEGTRPGEVLGKEPVEQPGVAHPRGGGPALHQLED